jgi:hypothetical protein
MERERERENAKGLVYVPPTAKFLMAFCITALLLVRSNPEFASSNRRSIRMTVLSFWGSAIEQYPRSRYLYALPEWLFWGRKSWQIK